MNHEYDVQQHPESESEELQLQQIVDPTLTYRKLFLDLKEKSVLISINFINILTQMRVITTFSPDINANK